MPTFTQSRQDQIEARAQHIERVIKPNIYAVGTLRQAQGRGMLVFADRGTYEAMARRFIERLSYLTYGKTHLERYNRHLPAAVTIEGLTTPKRLHLNILINKPDWKDEVEFEQHMVTEWNSLEWARRDFEIGARTGDCVRYSLKEGPDSLLFMTR